MDLDNQEWLYTLLMHKKLSQKEMTKLREYYVKQVQQKRKEIQELLTNINKLDKELGDLERWAKKK